MGNKEDLIVTAMTVFSVFTFVSLIVFSFVFGAGAAILLLIKLANWMM